MTSWITTDKIQWAISNFGNHKAAGPDGLVPMVLKQLPDRVLECLRVICVSSIYSGYVPRSWRKFRVIFIPKPGKGDYTKAKSFCPITLSSFIFKTLERVVLVHLEETYDVYNKLNKNQHAFRKGSSCDSALSDMVDELESAVFRSQYALGIFLDIKGAFDNLTVKASIRGMNNMELPSDIVRWYTQYFKHRTIETSIKGIHCQQDLTRGTPQGGILSPLVWNMAFDALLKQFNKGPVKAKGFADDAALVIKGPDIPSLIDKGQEAINIATAFGRDNGLEFGAEKTVVVMFTRKKFNPTRAPKLHMGNFSLDFSEEAKYLGVTLDSRLTFGPHIRNKAASVKRLITL